MFDILVYVFENYRQTDVSSDPERVAERLSAAGFDDAEINAALHWLAGVVRAPQRSVAPLPARSDAFRVFAPKELAKLDAECRGLLLQLEHAGILSAQDREHVVERALATADHSLSLDQLRLIILMVLWNQEAPASHLLAEELLSAHSAREPS